MKDQVTILLLMIVFSGCARYPQADDSQIYSLIASKIDNSLECYLDSCSVEQIHDSIQSLLENELTSQAAIQVAFLKNPHIQSILEELGIANADLVEAGLLSNPDFSLEVRYPHEKKLRTNLEYLITTAFLDIFLIPLRTKLAAVELEQVKRRVAKEILDLAFEVRQTYDELIAKQHKLHYTQSIVELTSIVEEIVSRQHLVGNVSLLDYQQVRARFLEAKLNIAKEQSEIIRLREKLNRLMGLSEDTCLILPDEISEEIDYQGCDLYALESIALNERLDFQEARFEVIRLSRMLGLKEWWTYTRVKAGVAGERDPDGLSLVGFGMSGEIPIFNFGQAERLRLYTRLRQAQDRLDALKIRILSEVREAHKLLMSDLERIRDYRVNILPLQNRISTSSEELYNVMGLGINRLLENKRQELEAYRNYLEILKDYWMMRVQLDRALGGYLFCLLN